MMALLILREMHRVIMDYRKMMQLRDEPHRVRALATSILETESTELSDQDLKFLYKLEVYEADPPLSHRQLEYLDGLVAKTSGRAKAGNYSAAKLIQKAWELRFDLSEDNEQWIVGMHAHGPGVAPSERAWLRLLAICRSIRLIPRDEWVDLRRA